VDYDGVTNVGFSVESSGELERALGSSIRITVVNRATGDSPWIFYLIRIPVVTSYKSGVITGQSTVNVNTTIDTSSLKSAEVELEFEILVIKDNDNLASVGDVDVTVVAGVGVEAGTESCLLSFLSFEGSAGLLIRLWK
jgi:hypothetical protein